MQRLSLLLNSVREPECPEGQTCEGPPNWKAVITFMGKRLNHRDSKPIVKAINFHTSSISRLEVHSRFFSALQRDWPSRNQERRM